MEYPVSDIDSMEVNVSRCGFYANKNHYLQHNIIENWALARTRVAVSATFALVGGGIDDTSQLSN